MRTKPFAYIVALVVLCCTVPGARAAVVFDLTDTGQTGIAFNGLLAHGPNSSPAVDTVNGVTIRGWISEPNADATRDFHATANGLGVGSFLAANNDATIDPAGTGTDPFGNPERPETVGFAFNSDVALRSITFAGNGLTSIQYRLPNATGGFDDQWQTADLSGSPTLVFDPLLDDVTLGSLDSLLVRSNGESFSIVELQLEDPQPTIPEPTSLFVWSGLLGLTMLRRRTRIR